jgi:hypothetical protein
MADDPHHANALSQTMTRAVLLDDGTYIAVADDQRDTVDVIPGIPRPELEPGGTPTAHLFPLGDVWQLQAGFQWVIDEEAIRGELARMLPDAGLSGRLTIFRVAISGVPRVRLDTMGIGPDAAKTLVAQTDSSGFPPYTALLSAQVTADVAGAIQAALAGAADRAVVTYDAFVHPDTSISAPLAAAATELGITYESNLQRSNGFTTVTACADLARWVQTEDIEKG